MTNCAECRSSVLQGLTCEAPVFKNVLLLRSSIYVDASKSTRSLLVLLILSLSWILRQHVTKLAGQTWMTGVWRHIDTFKYSFSFLPSMKHILKPNCRSRALFGIFRVVFLCLFCQSSGWSRYHGPTCCLPIKSTSCSLVMNCAI